MCMCMCMLHVHVHVHAFGQVHHDVHDTHAYAYVHACAYACVPTVAQHAAERLVVDLHCEPTSLLTQPTACFHVATALAIMAAYVHALALEEKM